MFISFLLPCVDRGAGPLFHWVMLAQMARMGPEEVVFVGDPAYFDPQHIPFGEVLKLGQFAFTCPTREEFARYRTHVLNTDLLRELYGAQRSHLDVFRTLLTEPVPQLERAIEQILDDVKDQDVEAFLSWCNCPSLEEVAHRRKMPVIHNEIGPLRSPLYRDTVYFDLRGVNGNTTPRTWTAETLREQMLGVAPMSADALRGRLVVDAARVREQMDKGDAGRHAIGVALQVEDDSNVVAFNEGWDALDLMYYALTRQPPEQVLVRSHPGARFAYRGGLGVRDDSADALAFLARCDLVVSINSSLLAEAALWEVPFLAMGDTPFASLGVEASAQLDTGERQLLLTALFLGYLAPIDLLFDLDYYRWRLEAPRSLAECMERHWPDTAEPVTWPALGGGAVAEAPAFPRRGAATWTAELSLEHRIRRMSAELERAHAELDEREALVKDLARWRGEAEKVWDNHEWLRGRVEELQALMVQHQEKQAGALHEAFEEGRRQMQDRMALAQEHHFALEGAAKAAEARHEEMREALTESHRVAVEAHDAALEHVKLQDELVQAAQDRRALEGEVRAATIRHGESLRAAEDGYRAELAAQRADFERALDQLREELAQGREHQRILEAETRTMAARHEEAQNGLLDRHSADLEALRVGYNEEMRRLHEGASRMREDRDLARADAIGAERDRDALRSSLQALHTRRLSLRERLVGCLKQSDMSKNGST